MEDETYDRYYELFNTYRHSDEAKQQELIGQMRANLIDRNDGEHLLRLYSNGMEVDLSQCDFEELNTANSTLRHYKK